MPCSRFRLRFWRRLVATALCRRSILLLVADDPFYCSFERRPDPDCEYTDVTSAVFNWTRLNGTTPSFDTGPYQAYDGDYYLYIEASEPRIAGDTAR